LDAEHRARVLAAIQNITGCQAKPNHAGIGIAMSKEIDFLEVLN
jgi:hypothetical protein